MKYDVQLKGEVLLEVEGVVAENMEHARWIVAALCLMKFVRPYRRMQLSALSENLRIVGICETTMWDDA